MTQTKTSAPLSRLCLDAKNAADLTTYNPVSLRDDATIPEAFTVLLDKGMHAAPVINEAGQPVGVLSGSDLLIHHREVSRTAAPSEAVRVRDLMTPAVFSVSLDAPARRVVEEFVSLNVSQLFVVDDSGALVGLISALNVLRRLT